VSFCEYCTHWDPKHPDLKDAKGKTDPDHPGWGVCAKLGDFRQTDNPDSGIYIESVNPGGVTVFTAPGFSCLYFSRKP
jgi:hypothetical protein